MDELEKEIENKANGLIQKSNENQDINDIIDTKIKSTDNVKSAIDLYATATALKQEETLEKVVGEKQEELRNDAEAKRIEAEADKISKETEKIKKEKEKELAELDKVISAKRKEVEQLNVESDKAQAFFESNKEILSYIGIKSKKTLKVMQIFMIPAIIVFMIVQLIALPLTIGGKIIEMVVAIVGGICGAIANSALKIIIAILIVAVLLGGGFCAYYFGSKLII